MINIAQSSCAEVGYRVNVRVCFDKIKWFLYVCSYLLRISFDMCEYNLKKNDMVPVGRVHWIIDTNTNISVSYHQ